ncbi:MAG: DUF4923 family protein [Alistipes sp.]|nr:DUF4923 family protein [Alistipes sp.]
MKRLFSLTLIVAAIWMLPTQASAQFNFGKLWGSIVGSDEPSRYEKLAESAPKSSDILGTWYYSSAKVDYFGDNILAEYAVDEIDGIAQDYLEAYGVDAGYFKVTLKRNGTVVGNLGDESLEGTYDYDDSNAKCKIYVTLLDTELSCDGYVEQYNNRLKVYLEAGDIVAGLKRLNLDINSSVLDMVYSVVSEFDDIMIAITFSRS